jgi:hypothetical protein
VPITVPSLMSLEVLMVLSADWLAGNGCETFALSKIRSGLRPVRDDG